LRPETQAPQIERVDVDEARRRVEAGLAVFVDVRRADAYAAGHIPGAVSVPARAVVARRHALPRSRAPVAY